MSSNTVDESHQRLTTTPAPSPSPHIPPPQHNTTNTTEEAQLISDQMDNMSFQEQPDELIDNNADSDVEEEMPEKSKDEIDLTLTEIFRHFAAKYGVPQKPMTALLRLLKYHKPTANYDLLPSTCKQLLKLPPVRLLPKPTVLEGGGTYLHFGVKEGLDGTSAGVLKKDANLLQFVPVYHQNPRLVPTPIKEKVFIIFF